MTAARTLQIESGERIEVAGQLAAFAVDVPADPTSIASVSTAGAVQGALFDPEVEL